MVGQEDLIGMSGLMRYHCQVLRAQDIAADVSFLVTFSAWVPISAHKGSVDVHQHRLLSVEPETCRDGHIIDIEP